MLFQIDKYFWEKIQKFIFEPIRNGFLVGLPLFKVCILQTFNCIYIFRRVYAQSFLKIISQFIDSKGISSFVALLFEQKFGIDQL